MREKLLEKLIEMLTLMPENEEPSEMPEEGLEAALAQRPEDEELEGM